MPVLDLSDEELQGFIMLAATASGPGVNWMLTNALLTKARLAQEANADKSGQTGPSNMSTLRTTDLGPLGGEVKLGNSQDKDDAAVPRA